MPEEIASPADPAADTSGDDLHRLSMTILMTPDMSNFAGNVHGGTLLKYLDQVAYTCATRYARNYAVTLSVDQVVFREPIHVGELVTFHSLNAIIGFIVSAIRFSSYCVGNSCFCHQVTLITTVNKYFCSNCLVCQ